MDITKLKINNVSYTVKDQAARTSLATKQDAIDDLDDIRDGAAKGKTALQEHQSLAEYAKKTELPVIPANVSAFNNDSGYLTSHQDISGKQDVIPDLETIRSGAELGFSAIQEHQSLAEYAKKTEIPDISNLALKSEIPSVPSNVSELNNDAGYLTEHQDISNLALKNEIPDISNLALKSEIPTVPSNVSELTNDAGYLTEHQSLAEYATKTELATAGKVKTVNSIEPDANGNITITIPDPDLSSKQDKLTEAQLAVLAIDHSQYLNADQVACVDDGQGNISVGIVERAIDLTNVYTKTELDNKLGNLDAVFTALGV